MPLDRKNQYHENGHTAQVIYRSNAIDIIHRTREKYFKIHMELKKSPNCQDNPKQKEQSWKHHTT